ncbi:MAG TPA: hypothetical protein VFD06_11270 [Candidatus Polarisedimenticolia bacterium]|nr:hypothetical protein [Candidatus Polarisedimenticolia bacterium]
MLSNALLDNRYQACDSLPIRTLVRDPDGDGAANPDPIIAIDPRPAAGSSLLITNRMAPNDGFFTPVNYRGAFGSDNWAAAWTNTGTIGYAASCGPGLTVVPDEVPNVQGVQPGRFTWDSPGLPGNMGILFYDVLRTSRSALATPISYAAATCVAADLFDAMVNDGAVPAVGEAFYYEPRAENNCGDGEIGMTFPIIAPGSVLTGPSCD